MRARYLLILVAALVVFAFLFALFGRFTGNNAPDEPPENAPVADVENGANGDVNNNGSEAAQTAYFIDIDIDPGEHVISGVMRVIFQNTSADPMYEIWFSVPLYEHLNVALATADLLPVDFEMQGRVLAIQPDGPISPGCTTEIALVFEAHISGLGGHTGASDYSMWAGDLFPILAVFDNGNWNTDAAESANFQVNITAPADVTIMATGLETHNQAVVNPITSVSVPLVRNFAFVALSGDYNSRSVITQCDVLVTVYYRCDPVEADIDAILDTARAAFEYFAARIGTFPYHDFDIVEVELHFHDSLYFPGVVLINSPHMREEGVHSTIENSVGRQWFFNVVGHNHAADPWLECGLVAFLQIGIHMTDEQIHETARMLYDGYTDLEEHVRRGKLMFYALWDKMGPDAFNDFLSAYYLRYAFSIASAADLIATAQEFHEDCLEEFFYEWINSPILPAIGNTE